MFPNKFYSQQDLSRVLLISNFNWKSPLSCPAFNQYFQTIRPSLDTKSFLVIEHRIVNFTNKVMDLQVTPWGYSILPLFLHPDPNTNSGHYQLPIYQGPVSHDTLQDYYDHSSHSTAHQLAYFRNTPLIKQTSLFLRLLDFQRDGHLSQ